MKQLIATIVYVAGIIWLFRLERDVRIRTSRALWIPMVWLFICSSRSVSQWLGLSASAGDQATLYAEGSPLDAFVFAGLEAAALFVVIGRWRRAGQVLRENWAIGVFFSYAALSIAWSDYPLVTFKHWTKGIGDVMMVLIVLTEPSFADAIKRLVTRLAFVHLPLSVLFIKYYPLLGRRLTNSWTEEAVGVSVQKNQLGELCSILGLGLVWYFRSAYNDREDRNRRRRLLALGVALAIIVWLLSQCQSMTSICTFSMASVVMLLSTRSAFRRKPAHVHLLNVGVIVCTLYALFFQSSGELIKGLGKDPSLTGRTDNWPIIISLVDHPLVGTGYESYWLGRRLNTLWNLDRFANFQINEAHNGYIEIFINLGWIGVVLLGVLIAAGYRNAIRIYRVNPYVGSLRIAWFLVTIITGFTEAAFREMGLPWIVFLIAITAAAVEAAPKTGGRRRAGKQKQRPAQESDAERVEALAGY